MKLIILIFAVLALGLATQKSDHWAVLIAGSNGYYNYRHQSDVCHAYQIMKKNGIPEDQIILFSYDDVANSPENPLKGQLYNKPDGEDVYAGCKIDYRAGDVTPEKFMSVLKGQGEGKVLKSNSNSKVFINFADHGAPGLIAFPNYKELHASDFHETLKFMHTNNMYKEMVLYIEACESGSMFENILEDNLNIYAATAANSHESSYAYYYGDNVHGKNLNTYLGDLFSISWMEDTDAADACSEDLTTQFDKVKKRTTESHVCKFGDMSFNSEVIGNFQGTCDAKTSLSAFLRSARKEETLAAGQAINSRDVKMDYLYRKYMGSNSDEDAEELQKEINNRQRIQKRFAQFEELFGTSNEEISSKINHECYKEIINLYKSTCGLDEHDLGFLKHFVAVCNTNHLPSEVHKAIRQMC